MQTINLHHRKSIRLKHYNYSSPGEYFVTICTHKKVCVFGEVVEDEVRITPIGEIAERCWEEIPKHFPNVELDEHIVMPNHIHGIILLNETNKVGAEYIQPLPKVNHIQPLPKTFQHVISKSLGSIIRSYKAAVSRECRKRKNYDFSWQRNYYEHIIRDDKDLNNIREYILNNPIKWYLDENNPNRPAD
jgi:putative transposase